MSLAKGSWKFGQPRFIDDGEDALYIEFPDRTVKYVPERTTTRHGKFKTKYGNRVPLCECCGYSIGDKRYNYCPNCGARIKERE